MIYGNKFYNHGIKTNVVEEGAIFIDVQTRKILDNTCNAIQMALESETDCRVKINAYGNAISDSKTNTKFISGKGNTYVYTIRLNTITQSKAPVIRWIKLNNDVLKAEIKRECGLEVSKIEVTNQTQGILAGTIGIAVTYER